MTSSGTGAALLIPCITAAAGLIGVIVGGWLADRRDREKQGRDYIIRQLSELYGPLLSLRSQVNARNSLRSQIGDAINANWNDDKRAFMKRQGMDDKQIHAMIKGEHTKFMDHYQWYSDTQYLPVFQKMIALLQDNIWLAEQSTRNILDTLIKYVDTLELIDKDVIDFNLLDELGFDLVEGSESTLRELYNDIEERHERLRAELTRKPRRITLGVRQLLRRSSAPATHDTSVQ
jgi:hypothetical protein